MTNDDVLGDAIPDDQQREMQKLCYWAVGVVSLLNLVTGFQELVTKLIYCESSKAQTFFRPTIIWHEGPFSLKRLTSCVLSALFTRMKTRQ